MAESENARSGNDGLMDLQIVDARFVADTIRMFELRHAKGGELPVFTAGAHLSLRVPNGEKRKYSLCNDPAERERYVIAVKREENGRGGSSSMVEQARVGDTIEVAAPRNDFALKHNQAGYIFVAGGIGITPILSMVRHLRSSQGPKFKLYYLSRSAATTAFADELSAPELRGIVKIHYDQGDPSQSLDLWPILEKPKGTHLYCCGPRALMQAVRDMTGHWSTAAVHFESFVDASATHRVDDRAFLVHLARSGTSVEIPKDKSILETLRAQGQRILSSCESGSCGTCKTGLVAGDVEHRDLVLSEAEKATNIMICVSRARSGDLTLDL